MCAIVSIFCVCVLNAHATTIQGCIFLTIQDGTAAIYVQRLKSLWVFFCFLFSLLLSSLSLSLSLSSPLPVGFVLSERFFCYSPKCFSGSQIRFFISSNLIYLFFYYLLRCVHTNPRVTLRTRLLITVVTKEVMN